MTTYNASEIDRLVREVKERFCVRDVGELMQLCDQLSAAKAEVERLTRPKLDDCIDGTEHAWVRRVNDEVYCARCMRCLSVESMLSAYVEIHGGTVRHG